MEPQGWRASPNQYKTPCEQTRRPNSCSHYSATTSLADPATSRPPNQQIRRQRQPQPIDQPSHLAVLPPTIQDVSSYPFLQNHSNFNMEVDFLSSSSDNWQQDEQGLAENRVTTPGTSVAESLAGDEVSQVVSSLERVQHQRRRQRNSEASARFRARKRQHADELEIAYDDTLEENHILRQSNATLQCENRLLRAIVNTSQGKDVPCRIHQ